MPEAHHFIGATMLITALVQVSAVAQPYLAFVPGDYLTTQAYDSNFSGSPLSATNYIYSFPYTQPLDEQDGLSASDNQFNVSGSGIQITIHHSLSGYATSSALSDGDIYIKPMFDLHYNLTSTYAITTPSGGSATYEQYLEVRPGGGSQDNQGVAPAGTTTNVSYGTTASAPRSGTLFAGTTYTLEYKNTLYSTAVGGTGATATGNINLNLSLLGDLNGDGKVDLQDLLTLVRDFGQHNEIYTGGDIDGDGTVTLEDFMLLVHHFGESVTLSTASPSVAVPEPMSILGMLLALVALRRHRCYWKSFRKNHLPYTCGSVPLTSTHFFPEEEGRTPHIVSSANT